LIAYSAPISRSGFAGNFATPKAFANGVVTIGGRHYYDGDYFISNNDGRLKSAAAASLPHSSIEKSVRIGLDGQLREADLQLTAEFGPLFASFGSLAS
jgi:hypothetical protein